jgi:hypothetical protein
LYEVKSKRLWLSTAFILLSVNAITAIRIFPVLYERLLAEMALTEIGYDRDGFSDDSAAHRALINPVFQVNRLQAGRAARHFSPPRTERKGTSQGSERTDAGSWQASFKIAKCLIYLYFTIIQ